MIFRRRLVYIKQFLIYIYYKLLFSFFPAKLRLDEESTFVISLASYPARAHLLPAVLESIKRQTVRPYKVFLVLCRKDWKGISLPWYVHRIERQGITIIWTDDLQYSVKMMVPVIDLVPDKGIVTLGDDWIYFREFISKTVNSKFANDGYIVGPLGKEMYRKGSELNMYYRFKNNATLNSKSENLYLMGLGTYYPANSLDPRVKNLDAIEMIVPGRGSDIWFWCAGKAQGTKMKCIGMDSVNNHAFPIPENKKTKPLDVPGVDEMNNRFLSAIDYFGIHELLLEQFPNQLNNLDEN
ncbi:glycosyltransferase [bacterium]|nr:MAG: glycosyltransferase [bacterium]